MKNLHEIVRYPLTEKELAVLAYVELGHEPSNKHRFKIIDGHLYGINDHSDSWQSVEDYWGFDHPLRIWNEAGRFMPNLSVLEK